MQNQDKFHIISKIVDRLKEYQPEKILLIGSYATGEADEYSDMDFVIIKKTDKAFLQRLVDVARIIGFDLGKVDVFVYSPEEWERMLEWENPFAEAVLRKGVIVYEKE